MISSKCISHYLFDLTGIYPSPEAFELPFSNGDKFPVDKIYDMKMYLNKIQKRMYNNNKFDSYYLRLSDCALHTLSYLIFITTCGKSVIVLILKMINEALEG